MAEDFRLPIFVFRLKRPPRRTFSIENQKSTPENDAITDND
jgi:hypothetical protein